MVFVWLDSPAVAREKLKDVAKYRKFTAEKLDEYARLYSDQHTLKMVQPAGPVVEVMLLDMTRACGADCSIDGVHQLSVVYSAAAQIILGVVAAYHPLQRLF